MSDEQRRNEDLRATLDELIGPHLVVAEQRQHVSAVPVESRFGFLGSWLKSAIRRATRFAMIRQSEFNESVVAALRAEQHVLRELVTALAAERDRSDRAEASLSGLRTDVAREGAQATQRLEHLELAFGERATERKLESDQLGSRLEALERAGVESASRLKALDRSLQDQRGQDRDVLDELSGSVREIEQEVGETLRDLVALTRRSGELGERIAALERAGEPELRLDHFEFTRAFRGDEDQIREQLAVYARRFDPRSRRVLDLGCGRGEFLDACRELGVGAYGVDVDPEMVGRCSVKGLEVVRGELIAHLAGLEDQSLDGLFSAQVIEHLAPAQVVELTELAAAKLKRGALFIVETVNPDCWAGLCGYHADLTHRQPIASATLQFLLERAGFIVHDLLMSAPVPEPGRLAPIAVPDGEREPELKGVVEAMNASLGRLNATLFGYRDYAIVAER